MKLLKGKKESIQYLYPEGTISILILQIISNKEI